MQTSYFSQLVSCLFSIVLVPTNIKGPLANQCCCNAPWTVDIVACWHKDIVTRHVFARTWWQYIYSKGHGDKTCLKKEMVTFWHDKRHAKRFPLSYQWPWWQTLGRWPSPGSSQRLQTQQNHALWKKKNINIFLFLILHLEPLKFPLFTHPVPGWWFGPNLVINIFGLDFASSKSQSTVWVLEYSETINQNTATVVFSNIQAVNSAILLPLPLHLASIWAPAGPQLAYLLRALETADHP